MLDHIYNWLSFTGVNEPLGLILSRVIAFIIMVIIAWLADLVTKKVLLNAICKFTAKTKTVWDDILVQRGIFNRLSHLAPAVVIYVMAPVVFRDYDSAVVFFRLAVNIYMTVIAVLVIDSFLSAVVDIYRTSSTSQKMPIRGFVQALKVVIFLIAAIVILSMILNKSPLGLLSGLGALTAVLMLIFKDSILGLVAGIQMNANQMVRIGDWIEMPKYGADGDVIDITLTTVKVQNWDKTITTIPAYALISDSFKNWRGMSESGGRRIKRNIHIDMTSVTFCTEAMLDKFRKIQYIAAYIDKRKQEIAEFNAQNQVDDSVIVNGRRMTNIGTFRAYVIQYLRHHPKIHQNMTFLVRHLEPTSCGLPIQIYVFSNDQVWANYEAIQADIFDHLLAVIPEFELRVFQNPTGADFQKIMSSSVG